MLEIVLATRNAKKADELQRILQAHGISARLRLATEFPNAPEVPETESTFEGNALLKARALAKATGLPAIADDSGLCVDALNGMPGVLSARWSGATADVDRTNLELVLNQIADVQDAHRGAQFVCAAALVLPDGREFVRRGEMRGQLVREPRGSNGFGYDPAFIADGQTLTNAELRPAEKDAISHRGQALAALVGDLAAIL